MNRGAPLPASPGKGGNPKLEAGNWKIEIGNWKPETRNVKFEIRDWKVETRVCASLTCPAHCVKIAAEIPYET